MKYYAIIVGGGSGKRMQQAVPKQFLLLNNKPVLMHTIAAFYNSSFKPSIIVVLPSDLHDYWNTLCLSHHFTLPHQLINGGQERFHSVRNGLLAIKDQEAIVAVHDAVRPMVNETLIASTFDTAQELGNAICCIKPNDSVRKIKKNSENKVIDRDTLVLIQTPQVFEVGQLRKAYQQRYQRKFTDDASVVEQAGFKINLVDGARNNFKITYPEDLELANFLLKP